MKLVYQQGDILLELVQGLPDNVKPVLPRDNVYILAEGEQTGHSHCIEVRPTVDVFVDEKGNLFVRAKKAVTIKHEEHKHQRIKRGVYKIGKVREVDPFSEEIRSVRD